MTIPIDCPKCGKKLRALESLLGKKIQCPDCATKIPVERPRTNEDIAPAEDVVPAAVKGPSTPPPRPAERRRERDDRDDYDDRENRFRKREADDGGVSTMIPYKNGKALAAYYCGVFGMIPVLGLVLGPIALILGILGFSYARAHPQAKGMAHAIVGIILGLLATLGNWGPTLFVIVLAILEINK